MSSLGPHAVFIVTAYSVALVVIAGLIAWVALDYSTQRAILAQFEKRGIRRRSQGSKRPGKTS
jgi:heme exporter protein D